MLLRKTDDEVKALLGKPDRTAPSSDLTYTDWYYTRGWLKAPEGEEHRGTSGMVLRFRAGHVFEVVRH